MEEQRNDGVTLYHLVGPRQPQVKVFSPMEVVFGCTPQGGVFEADTASHSGVFVYVKEGELLVNEQRVTKNQLVVFEEPPAGSISVKGVADRSEFLYCAGATVDQPWIKYLMHNGFVICRDLEQAKHKEALYAEQRDGFGKQ